MSDALSRGTVSLSRPPSPGQRDSSSRCKTAPRHQAGHCSAKPRLVLCFPETPSETPSETPWRETVSAPMLRRDTCRLAIVSLRQHFPQMEPLFGGVVEISGGSALPGIFPERHGGDAPRCGSCQRSQHPAAQAGRPTALVHARQSIHRATHNASCRAQWARLWNAEPWRAAYVGAGLSMRAAAREGLDGQAVPSVGMRLCRSPAPSNDNSAGSPASSPGAVSALLLPSCLRKARLLGCRRRLRIPTKSPPRTDMMSPPDSDMMSPPEAGAALAFEQ